jgi:hypothetical protein
MEAHYDIFHGLNGKNIMKIANVYSLEQKEYTSQKNDWNNT